MSSFAAFFSSSIFCSYSRCRWSGQSSTWCQEGWQQTARGVVTSQPAAPAVIISPLSVLATSPLQPALVIGVPLQHPHCSQHLSLECPSCQAPIVQALSEQAKSPSSPAPLVVHVLQPSLSPCQPPTFQAPSEKPHLLHAPFMLCSTRPHFLPAPYLSSSTRCRSSFSRSSWFSSLSRIISSSTST